MKTEATKLAIQAKVIRKEIKKTEVERIIENLLIVQKQVYSFHRPFRLVTSGIRNETPTYGITLFDKKGTVLNNASKIPETDLSKRETSVTYLGANQNNDLAHQESSQNNDPADQSSQTNSI